MEDNLSVFRELSDYFMDLTPEPVSFDKFIDFLMSKVGKAVKNGYLFDCLVSGGQGMGKSTVALYLLYKYYGNVNKALSEVYFRVEDLQDALLSSKHPVVLLDDAGITLSKYRFMSEEAIDYVILQQIARTRANGIFYTTVYDNIIKHLRDIVDIVVSMHTRVDNIVYGSVYAKKTKYFTIVKKLFDFKLDLDAVHSDKEFHSLYDYYNVLREKFITSVVRELREKRRMKEKKQEEDVEEFYQDLLKRQKKEEEVKKIIEDLKP